MKPKPKKPRPRKPKRTANHRTTVQRSADEEFLARLKKQNPPKP